jgi:hypothetical protein
MTKRRTSVLSRNLRFLSNFKRRHNFVIVMILAPILIYRRRAKDRRRRDKGRWCRCLKSERTRRRRRRRAQLEGTTTCKCHWWRTTCETRYCEVAPWMAPATDTTPVLVQRARAHPVQKVNRLPTQSSTYVWVLPYRVFNHPVYLCVLIFVFAAIISLRTTSLTEKHYQEAFNHRFGLALALVSDRPQNEFKNFQCLCVRSTTDRCDWDTLMLLGVSLLIVFVHELAFKVVKGRWFMCMCVLQTFPGHFLIILT